MGILDNWIDDMPQQFQGKERIEALISAFAKQVEELHRVFKQLDLETDLESAVGMNLDMVGDIISLTRKEAGILAGIDVEEPVISDERYRQYLKYKMLCNTGDCTYYDIIQAIEILWDVDKVRYYERMDRPATIFIGLPAVDIEDNDQAKGKPSIMKPAGVGFFYTAQYSMIVDQSAFEIVKFIYMEVHTFFYFFKRILNGEWPLGGLVSLGQIPICEVAMGIEVNIPFCMNTKIGVDEVIIEKDLWYLDGKILMDGSRILDAEIWKEIL